LTLTERHLVNAIVGLCKATKFWPRDLHDLGYKVHSIEQAFTNSQGTPVTPDIIVVSEPRNHAIVFECKSGGYVKASQIEKYPHITDRDINVKALVPTSDPGGFRADVAIFCLEEKFPSVRVDLETEAWPCPVIGLAPQKSITLLMNAIREFETDARFRNGIQLTSQHRIPTHYVPLMSSHATDYEVASSIMPHLVATLRQGITEFTVLDLCIQVFKDMWDVIDPAEQQKMGHRVSTVLTLASKTDMRSTLKRLQGTKLDQRWTMETPADPKNDLAFYRGLRARTRRLLERLRKGGSKLDNHYTQLTPEDVMNELERRSRNESDDPQGSPS
jgi:hypothetical protein